MSKTIITFLFTLIITASIVAPTFVNLSESTMEITEIVDFGEEEENKGKESIKDLEVKIYYSTDKESVFLSLEHKKRIRYCSKNYTFKFAKLNSPPPEQLFV
ncbi:MAG: hypothetical protein P8M14_00630 [Flavobacteriaceae bacterium]|nr:hypothetical protein [Flavobacteriaceae bacterium]MDG2443933.1 hypothetical protein [Flavobacteriaceae bacterium]